MARYVVLFDWTNEGVGQARTMWEAMGVRIEAV